jgi:HlyD family secretion protein
MKKKRVWLTLLVLAIAGGSGFAYYKKKNAVPAGTEVETQAASRRTIVQTVTATGRIQPKTQVSISADVSAKITQIAVKEGDWVEKGTLLVELDRERHLAQVEMAEASLRAAISNAELARENMVKAGKDFDRSQGLYEQKLEPTSSHDASLAVAGAEKARHRSSLDEVERTRATLKQVRDDLGKTRIFAPLSGTVSKLNKEVGEIALGSQFQADVILEISNLSGMEAVVDVDENDIVRLSLGDPATIEVDALPDTKLRGEVTEIANSAKLTAQGTTDQKTEFEVKVTVTEANPRLRPGMTASAEVTTETKDGVLGVPLQSVAVRTLDQLKGGIAPGGGTPEELVQALKPDAEGFVTFVFVVSDGRARVRQVKTGIQSESHIEVLEGLEQGDEVVIGNYRAISKDLQHGSIVRAKRQPDANPIAAAKG